MIRTIVSLKEKLNLVLIRYAVVFSLLHSSYPIQTQIHGTQRHGVVRMLFSKRAFSRVGIPRSDRPPMDANGQWGVDGV